MRAAVLVFCGCAQGLTLAPKPDAAPSELAGQTFGVPGEVMEYQGSLRGVMVGRVQVAVGQPGWVDGRPSIIVRSRGTTAGFLTILAKVTWELTTTLDMITGLPLRELDEAWIEERGEEPEHERSEREGSSQYNVHAAAGALRGWRSREGQRASLEVMIDGQRIEVDLWDAAREYLASAKQPAVRYDGIALDKYHFSIWISNDEARVPLLLRTQSKIGEIAIELVSYEAPKD